MIAKLLSWILYTGLQDAESFDHDSNECILGMLTRS